MISFSEKTIKLPRITGGETFQFRFFDNFQNFSKKTENFTAYSKFEFIFF